MDDATKDLMWVFGIIVVIAIVWYYSGGMSRVPTSPFIEKPSVFELDETKNAATATPSKSASSQPTSQSGAGNKPITGAEGTGQNIQTEKPTTTSSYFGKVSIESWYAKNTDPDEEYVVITTDENNQKKIPLTTWTLKSETGFDIKIGKGSYLPYSNEPGPQEDIFLNPGEKAYVVTGRSPINTNFRLNKCTGYFEQFQNFNPPLPIECPSIMSEPRKFSPSDTCLDFIERLPTCTTQINIPANLQGDAQCKDLVNKTTSYFYCVNNHKNDTDFYKPEWRIYLGRDQEIWKQKRETISLFDEKGELVAEKSY